MILNAIGTSKVSDLRQGRGIVSFAKFRNGITDYRTLAREDIGNVSSFTIGSNRETVSFYSSRKGLRTRMKEAVSTNDLGPVTFTGSEWSFNNMGRLLRSDLDSQVQDFAAFAASTYQIIGYHEAGNGRSYPLLNRFGERLVGIGTGGTVGTGVSDHMQFRIGSTGSPNIVGETSELRADGFPVGTAAYSEVILDRNAGTVFVPAYVPLFGAVEFRINVAIPNTASQALNRSKVEAFSAGSIKGQLSVRMYDACSESGLAFEEWLFHNVELVMDGDISIISDADFDEFNVSALLSQDSLGRTLTVYSHEKADSYTI